MPYLLTIGNTTPRGFADWMPEGTPDVTILPTLGTFLGAREHGVAVIVWTEDREVLAELLATYGADHPDELAFGITPLPESNLHSNPAAILAA